VKRKSLPKTKPCERHGHNYFQLGVHSGGATIVICCGLCGDAKYIPANPPAAPKFAIPANPPAAPKLANVL
jgi:hypothetical protein